MSEEKKPTYAQRAVVAESEVERLQGLMARGREEFEQATQRIVMLEERLTEQAAAMAKLEADKKRTDGYYESASKRATEAESLIEQMQQVIDALPNAPERAFRRPNSSYDEQMPLPVRLTSAVLRGCFKGV